MSVRFDPSLYAALERAAAESNRSMNALVNEAVAAFLVSPRYRRERDRYQETIRRLGGDES